MRPVLLIREVNFGLNTIMVIHTHSLIVNATLNKKSEERANFPTQSISWLNPLLNVDIVIQQTTELLSQVL